MGSSHILVAINLWQQVQFSAVEENSDSVVVEVTESSGGGFQGLDSAVESFGHSVADSVPKPGEDIVESTFDHPGLFLDRIQLAA